VSEFLRLPLGFFRAHKTLKLRFTQSNRGLGTRNLFFNFVQTIFHLLALDRVQPLRPGLDGKRTGGNLVAIRNRRQCGRRNRVLRKAPVRVSVLHWPFGVGLGLRTQNRETRTRWQLATGNCVLLSPEIVFVISRIDFHFAFANLEHPRGQLVDEIAVVGNENYRAGVLHQGFEQDVFGAQVEVVGGLIEQQEVGGVQQHFEQRVAIALSAGEDADALKDIVAREKKTAEQAAQLGLRGGGREFAEVVEDASFRIEFFILVLREIVGLDVVAELVFAGGERLMIG